MHTYIYISRGERESERAREKRFYICLCIYNVSVLGVMVLVLGSHLLFGYCCLQDNVIFPATSQALLSYSYNPETTQSLRADPRGSKYPTFKDSASENHTLIYSVVLGSESLNIGYPWTLWASNAQGRADFFFVTAGASQQ